LRAGVGGLAALAVQIPPLRTYAQAQTAGVTAAKLAESVHLLTIDAVNVLAKTDQDGTVLVDGGPAAAADNLLEAVAALPAGGPVHTLFNTHWHPEQTGLNERLGTAGATIIAHENTRLWLTTDIAYPYEGDGRRFEPLPAVAQPNLTFYDNGKLGADIEYGYLRHAAHTDGDLYVYLPDDDVLAVGDTITGPGGGWPFVDWWTGGWIGGLVGNLELLLYLAGPDTRIVPGRGTVLRRSDLETQFTMYNSLYEQLSRDLNSGLGPAEAVAGRPAAEFERLFGPSDAFVGQAFQSLWAYLSPDA
jgi:glyoxylase-like metal-dependent hydrolase (beta-lactamase superfamily II)